MEGIHHRLRKRVSFLLSYIYILCSSKKLTFTYNSQTSMKNDLIPSSFFPSCNSTNFISERFNSVCTIIKQWCRYFLLPGVTKADTVHSLNLSTDLKYLSRLNHHCHRVSTYSCTTIYAHCVLLAHHVLDHIQAGISDHLKDMSVLSTSHTY